MDKWLTVLTTSLDSPEFEFKENFIGGNIIVKKDYVDDGTASWFVHIYFVPEELRDRPIVADICIRHGTKRREICSALWLNESCVGHVHAKEKTGRLIVAARLRKLLYHVDIMQPSAGRSFVVQNFNERLHTILHYNVNALRLNNSCGGDLFLKWKIQQEAGVSTINEPLESSLLEALLECTATYEDLVVLRHTVDRLTKVARQFRMTRLMRAIEEFYIETNLLQWEEKLLISIQNRMSRLYVQVERKILTSPWANLCRIQRALISRATMNGQTKNCQDSAELYHFAHKNIIDLISLTEQNILIG